MRKYKYVAGGSTFDKVTMYALSCLALSNSNADGTNFLKCYFTKNNVKESNEG